MSTAARLQELKAKAAEKVQRAKAFTPVYKSNLNPSLLVGQPHVTTGPIRDSEGYSFAKAFAYAGGVIPIENCKEVAHTHERMKAFMPGWRPSAVNSFLMPISSNPLYFGDAFNQDAAGRSFMKELRQKMYAEVEKADPDEISYLRKKALGTFPSTAGGSMVPAPMLSSEVIDLQRNAQVFSQLGSREVGLPPQGAMRFARQTGASTAYWVGEAATITESQLATGDLELNAKKLGVIQTISQELLMFSNPSAELLARQDMAEVSALAADLSMLQGTGGTQIKGLITYTGDSNTYLNIKSYTASTVATDGNTFQPNDVLGMISQLPDAVRSKELKWAMAPTLWAAIANRRADAVSANDGKGAFLFNTWRGTGETIQVQLDGRPVVTSGQISTARTKGSGTNLTYALVGHWPEWMIGRYGAVEMLANPFGTTFTTAQVQLRSIFYIDAGPRTPNSFVFCDQLLQS